MQPIELAIEIRQDQGKGAARQLRRQGKIPAVFYGPKQKNFMLATAPSDLTKALSTEYLRNAVLKLNIEGIEYLALVRELQRDQVSGSLLHADFYHVDMERSVVVDVPFSTTGRAAGVVKGGELNVVHRTVPVKTVPSKIPVKIEVDVTPLDIGEHVSVVDLKLEEGLEVILPAKESLVGVLSPSRKRREEEEEAAQAGTPGAPGASGTTPPPASS